jgi:hypothetical protein
LTESGDKSENRKLKFAGEERVGEDENLAIKKKHQDN